MVRSKRIAAITLTGEGRCADDADAHRVHQLVHLGLAVIGGLSNTVSLEGTRRRAAALVEGGDEARLLRKVCHNLVIEHDRVPCETAGTLDRTRLSID
jgi:hypothetical protein